MTRHLRYGFAATQATQIDRDEQPILRLADERTRCTTARQREELTMSRASSTSPLAAALAFMLMAVAPLAVADPTRHPLPDDPLGSPVWKDIAAKFFGGAEIVFDQRVKVNVPGDRREPGAGAGHRGRARTARRRRRSSSLRISIPSSTCSRIRRAHQGAALRSRFA